MAFRFRRLAVAAGAAALPAAALTALLPGTAAQASTAAAPAACAASQVTVYFDSGSSRCQSLGLALYNQRVDEVCAGSGATAILLALSSIQVGVVQPGTCVSVHPGPLPLPNAVLVLPAL